MDWGYKHIILETDCLQVVKEYINPNPSSPLYGLLTDVVDIVSSLDEFSLVFFP